MSSIAHDEAWRCLRVTVQESNGAVRDGALRLMAAAAGDGLAYGLQSIGHHAWELSGSPKRPTDCQAAQTTVESAGQDIADKVVSSIKVVSSMRPDLGKSDQSYLRALSECGGQGTPREIARRLLGMSGRTLARAERRLVAAGHVHRTDRGKVRLMGPFTAGAIQGLAASEAEYELGDIDPAPLASSSSSQTCNAYMPRAKAKCALGRGHKGGHRSKV